MKLHIFYERGYWVMEGYYSGRIISRSIRGLSKICAEAAAYKGDK